MSRPDQDVSQRQEPAAPNRSNLWMLLLLVVAGAFIFLLRGRLSEFGGEAIGVRHPAVGRHLPELELQALTGDVKDISLKDLAGKVAVVNFWGTWCPPCRAEFPELAAFWVQMRDQPDFQFLSVSCEGIDDDLGPLREQTSQFLVMGHYQLPTYADRGAQTRRNVAMVLGENGFAYPTTLVLDQAGVIRGVWIGYAQGVGDQLKQLVEELLKK